jgi:hypothetical protein
MSNSNENLLRLVKDLTYKLESTSRFEKIFRNNVREKINNFVLPIKQATDYIIILKKKIKELELQLKNVEDNLNDNLDSENAETIKEARTKLNEFTNYIQNTEELNSSLNNLGNAIDELKKLSGEKLKKEKKEGGGRKKFRKTRKILKKRKAKRSYKIKYH